MGAIRPRAATGLEGKGKRPRIWPPPTWLAREGPAAKKPAEGPARETAASAYVARWAGGAAEV